MPLSVVLFYRSSVPPFLTFFSVVKPFKGSGFTFVHTHLQNKCGQWESNPHGITTEGFSYYSMSPQPSNIDVVVWTMSSPYLTIQVSGLQSLHIQDNKLSTQHGVLCLPSPFQPDSTLKVSLQALSTISCSIQLYCMKHIKVPCVCLFRHNRLFNFFFQKMGSNHPLHRHQILRKPILNILHSHKRR